MNKRIDIRFSVLVVLIVLASCSRMIPHPSNFSPLGAIALFGSAYFAKRWQALLIPIAATWLSDLFINNMIYSKNYSEFTFFYEGFLWTYLSYLLIALWGLFLFKKITPKRVLGGALGATLIFFLISNLGCINTQQDSISLSELFQLYASGIPYIKGTLLGDLFYSLALFGGFNLAVFHFPILKKVD